jgi:hypothetical protein
MTKMYKEIIEEEQDLLISIVIIIFLFLNFLSLNNLVDRML